MNDPLLSTTSTVSRIRGFSIILLFCLKDGCLRTRDICEKLDKYLQYVNRYLYNLQNYGLVEKVEDFWILTEEGADFIEYLEDVDKRFNIIRKKYERNKKEIRKKKERILRKKICYAPRLPLRRVGAKRGKFKLSPSLETATLMI